MQYFTVFIIAMACAVTVCAISKEFTIKIIAISLRGEGLNDKLKEIFHH